MARRKAMRQNEGINWGLIVGGAAATVLSLAFSHRKKMHRVDRSKKASSHQDGDAHGHPMEAEVISLHRESSSSSEASEGDQNAIVFVMSQNHGDFNPSARNGPVENPSFGETEDMEATKTSPDVHLRDAVRKLRQQLKSRDEMIMEMQSQLSEKDRKLYSHKSLIGNLEGQLKEANDSIFEVERVIHDLNETNSCRTPVAEAHHLEAKATGICRSQSPGLGNEELALQESNQDLSRDKRETSLVVRSNAGEYQLIFERAKHLEAELLGIRAMACEMASLLEVSERERLRLHHVASQLQQKLAFQTKELNTMRATICMADSTQSLKLSQYLTRSAISSRFGNDSDTDKGLARLSSKNDANIAVEDRYLEAPHSAKQLEKSQSTTAESYRGWSEDLEMNEVTDMDASRVSAKDESTSTSRISYPEFSASVHSFSNDGSDWSFEEEAGIVMGGTGTANAGQYSGQRNNYSFKPDGSPGVRIGSPTIAGSQSIDSSTMGARRYLFDTTDENHHLLYTMPEDKSPGVSYSNLATGDLHQSSSMEEEPEAGLQDSYAADDATTEEGSAKGTGSIDTNFDEMLDDTLDDLVKVCSTATTPRGAASNLDLEET